MKLYILPFDHRTAFMARFGVSPHDLTPEQTAMITGYKHVIYEAFLKALEMGVPKEVAAILVEEQFGAKIQEEARTQGIRRALTTEKSGQKEFDFEYGEAFREHIDKFKPEYVKVLVRYNPAGNAEANRRQIERLKTLNDFCRTAGYKFLFELLAVATKENIEKLDHNILRYEAEKRYEVMAASIRELQDAGIEPDVWKVEGLDSAEQMAEVVATAKRDDRDNVDVVVLGRGESEDDVRRWLSVAAKVPGVIGFAVGRTIWSKPLLEYHQKAISREEAIKKIAANYKSLVDLFEKAQSN